MSTPIKPAQLNIVSVAKQATVTLSPKAGSSTQDATLLADLTALYSKLKSNLTLTADISSKAVTVPVGELHKQLQHSITLAANKLKAHISSATIASEPLNYATQVENAMAEFHVVLTSSASSSYPSQASGSSAQPKVVTSEGFNREMRNQLHNSNATAKSLVLGITNFLNTHPTLTTKDKECLQLAGQALTSLLTAQQSLQKMLVTSSITNPNNNLQAIESAL
jgi:hypothetical protein